MAEEKPEQENNEVEDVEKATPEHEPKHHAEKADKSGSHWQRFLVWYKTDKKKSIPLTIMVLLLLLAALPFSRYHVAGLVLKKDFVLVVKDSKTGTPVSGAEVRIRDVSATTNAVGGALLPKLPVGQYTVFITKKYYDDRQAKVVVPILRPKSQPQISFTARGRQVKIVVTNLIDYRKLDGVDIKIAGANSKTDGQGTATIVVPTGVNSVKATLSADGYNDSDVTVQVSDKQVKENDFKLTPAGKVYFLSKLSGKIDVVRTNLDGTGRATVLAGTGREEDRGTILLAARDWKYLALLSKRDNGNPKLYLIDTSNDSLTVMDTTNATFSPVGWSDDNFVYTLTRNDVQLWQPNRSQLKSYSAANKQITLLDQTKGQGTSFYNYQTENYNQVYQIGKTVVYSKIWDWGYSAPASPDWGQKTNAIYSISATGSSAQTLKTFPLSAGSGYINSVPYEASGIYYQVYNTNNNGLTYFIYLNGKVTQATSDISNQFNEYQQNPVTYLQSPSGSSTFWAESRDGKHTLFIGDQGGENGKQILALSEFQTYGWFTDDYLLASKNSSELYIMSKSVIGKDSDAIKISDYHKPTQNFYGYGGGYGGI